MSHLLKEAQQQVLELKQPGYLLTTIDVVAPKNQVLNLAVEEVTETTEALKAGNTLESAREFADVLVFYFSWMAVHAPQINADENLIGVNGFGRRSNAYEKLQETIVDSQDDPRAVVETLRRIWSIAIWNPFAQEGLLQMEKVLDKVQANYPKELFTDFDPTLQRISTPDEVIARYDHLKGMLRLIRNAVSRTLQPADWQPHVEIIQDWQHSIEAYQRLQQRLANGRKN